MNKDNNKDDIPNQVREYMSSIGHKGGSASKGTEAAKIRSAKATAARLTKEAALKEQGQVPPTPAWHQAVKEFLTETNWIDRENKDKFGRLYLRAIEHDDMRQLGTAYFTLVKQHLKEKVKPL